MGESKICPLGLPFAPSSPTKRPLCTKQYTGSYSANEPRQGVVPYVNGVSYMGNYSLYASNERLLTYPVALYLSNGDTFRLLAARTSTVVGQQFSAHYVGDGDTVTGFSVRYNGTHPVSPGQSLFANSAAGRTTVYSQGGGYTENGYTAPLTGAYQVR